MPFCIPWAPLPRPWLSIGVFIIFLTCRLKKKVVFSSFSSQENVPRLFITGSKRPNDYFFEKVYFLFSFLFCLLVTSGRLLFYGVFYSLIINRLTTIYCTDSLLKCFISEELTNIGGQYICKFENIYIYVMRDVPV